MFDVGCGALVGPRRQQAAQATHPPSARATPFSQQIWSLLIQYGVHKIRSLCVYFTHHDQITRRKAGQAIISNSSPTSPPAQSFTNMAGPLVIRDVSPFSGHLRLACSSHAAMQPCNHDTLVTQNLGSVPSLPRGAHAIAFQPPRRRRDTGCHCIPDAQSWHMPMKAHGFSFHRLPWRSSDRVSSLRLRAMDSNFGYTIRLRLRGTQHARPTDQPLRPPTCVSILESVVLGRMWARDALQLAGLTGDPRRTQTERDAGSATCLAAHRFWPDDSRIHMVPSSHASSVEPAAHGSIVCTLMSMR